MQPFTTEASGKTRLADSSDRLRTAVLLTWSAFSFDARRDPSGSLAAPLGARRSEKVKFEYVPPFCIVVRVRYLKTVAVFGFLAFWLAASNHCRLELIPCLSFLACCEPGDGLPSQDKDCETDGCAAVESGFYKTEDGQASVSAPQPATLTLLLPLLLVQVPPATPVAPDVVPPELPVTWQFSFRAAAPPRAPSLVS